MPNLTVTELDQANCGEAWPLVRLASPHWLLGKWKDHARALWQRGGGVLGARTESGGLLGVATYEPVERRHLGMVLNVETLVAFELSRREPVRRALCETLDERAAGLGCGVMTLSAAAKGLKIRSP